MKPNRCHLAPLVVVVLILGLGPGVVIALESEGAGESNPAADWFVGTIDAIREVGYNVSVATDPETGETYISYYEGVDGDLWLARTGAPVGNCGPGNTWKCQVLDSTGVVGKYSSIAVGGQGPLAKLFISYHDVNSGSLKVFEGEVDRATGVLSGAPYIVDQGTPAGGVYIGTATAAAISDSGTAHIAYQETSGATKAVKHATKVIPSFGNCGPGDSWRCGTIHLDVEVGDFIDIDIAPDGDPVIAFSSASGNDAYPVIASRVASGGSCNSSDVWNCSFIHHSWFETGEYVSIAIDDDSLYLAYRNESTRMLEVASLVGAANGNCGLWDSYQCDSIDDMGLGGVPSGIDMEIDDDGHPIIAYHDLELGFHDLKIAWPVGGLSLLGNCGPLNALMLHMWRCETLNEGDVSHAEAYGGLSIALNANGEAAVAYRELFDPILSPEEGRLKVALEPISIFLDGFESGDTLEWTDTVP